MADPTYEPQPVTLDGFLADRQRMWSGFTTGTVFGVIAVIVILLFLAFLTL